MTQASTATVTSAAPTSPLAPVIEARGLTKRYGERLAVDHLDLSVAPGQIYGLLGPNGAGKTTTILMLLGLTEPTEGHARVCGLDPARDALAVKRRVGYLPDDVGFYPSLTARQNLAYTARLNGLGRKEAEERIDEVLAAVHLTADADREVGAYSRGMRQRLGLADALVKDPAVLILDEPTVNVDPEGVREILELIRRLRDERGVSVLLSSHLLHQVQEICDHVAIFVRGRVAARGRLDELVEELGDQWTIEVGTNAAPEVLARVPGVQRVEPDGSLLVVHADRDVRGAITQAVVDSGATITHLFRRGADLDALYRQWYRDEAGVA